MHAHTRTQKVGAPFTVTKYRDSNEDGGFKAAVRDLGSRTFATAREIKSTELLRGMLRAVSSDWLETPSVLERKKKEKKKRKK